MAISSRVFLLPRGPSPSDFIARIHYPEILVPGDTTNIETLEIGCT